MEDQGFQGLRLAALKPLVVIFRFTSAIVI